MLIIIVLAITEAEIFFKQPVLPCVDHGEKISVAFRLTIIVLAINDAENF